MKKYVILKKITPSFEVYSSGNGNHRTIISKIVFSLEETMTGYSNYLMGNVSKTIFEVDHELTETMKNFIAFNEKHSMDKCYINLDKINSFDVEIENGKETYFDYQFTIVDGRYFGSLSPRIQVNRKELILFVSNYLEKNGKLTFIQKLIDFIRSSERFRITRVSHGNTIFMCYLGKSR